MFHVLDNGRVVLVVILEVHVLLLLMLEIRAPLRFVLVLSRSTSLHARTHGGPSYAGMAKF